MGRGGRGHTNPWPGRRRPRLGRRPNHDVLSASLSHMPGPSLGMFIPRATHTLSISASMVLGLLARVPVAMLNLSATSKFQRRRRHPDPDPRALPNGTSNPGMAMPDSARQSPIRGSPSGRGYPQVFGHPRMAIRFGLPGFHPRPGRRRRRSRDGY